MLLTHRGIRVHPCQYVAKKTFRVFVVNNEQRHSRRDRPTKFSHISVPFRAFRNRQVSLI